MGSSMPKSEEFDYQLVACLVCGEVLCDIIDDLHPNCQLLEYKRQFLIGLLCEPKTDLEFLNFYKCNKKHFSDPFVCGYAFRLFLDNETKNGNKLSLKENTAKFFWNKYSLSIPEYQPFFDSCMDDPNPGLYIGGYQKLQKIKNKLDTITVSNVEIYNEEEICIKFAYDYHRKYLKGHMNLLHSSPKEKSKSKKDRNKKVKWYAETQKMQYYEMGWTKLTNIIANGDEQKQRTLDQYFQALKAEIENIQNVSNHAKKGRTRDEMPIIFLPLLATIVNAITIAAQNIDSPAASCIVAIATVISASLSACITVSTLIKKHHAYEETWLRHQLNYSRIIGELEEFTEGIGKYKRADLNSAEEIQRNLQAFQEQIAWLRKKDYANFFNNMNCINFENVANVHSQPQFDTLADNNSPHMDGQGMLNSDDGTYLLKIDTTESLTEEIASSVKSEKC